MLNKQFYVYILTNKHNTVLYVGVTNNLVKRVYEHKNKLTKGFSEKYNLDKLVYYEVAYEAESAIKREKQIKGQSREKKKALIDAFNVAWVDLYEKIM